MNIYEWQLYVKITQRSKCKNRP